MVTRRGTSNTNARGSNADRRRRKLWLLREFGDGTSALCSFDGCDAVLTFETITVDRFPLTGIDGGTYVHGNIRPACGPHNSEHGGRLGAARRAAKAERIVAERAARRAGSVGIIDGLQRPSKPLGLRLAPL